MKKVYRSLLLFISLVMFLAIAPIVILYAVGYRANFNMQHAVDPLPVGVLAVETQPRRATITVNDREVGNSSRVVTNLPPGTSQVKVTLDGYREWAKKVQIEPGRAAEFRNIVLIPQKLLPNVFLQNARQFVLSPNHRLLAVVHNNRQLLVLDQTGQILLPDMVVPSMVSSMEWSSDNNYLLINGTKGAHYVLAISQGKTLEPLSALNKANNITWDPRLSGRILYLDQANNLQALNVSTKTSVTLLTEVTSFVTTSNQIVAMRQDGIVGTYTFAGDVIKTSMPTPSVGKIKQLIVSDNNQVAYLMKDKSLWLLAEDGSVNKISTTAVQAIWASGGQLLLIQPDANSLYVYNYADERNPIALHTMQLITRLSRPITHPQWFSDGIHIVYQIEDEIWFSETDPRDYPVTYQIDTTNSGQANVAGGENGATLYYIQRISGQNSLLATSLVVSKK